MRNVRTYLCLFAAVVVISILPLVIVDLTHQLAIMYVDLLPWRVLGAWFADESWIVLLFGTVALICVILLWEINRRQATAGWSIGAVGVAVFFGWLLHSRNHPAGTYADVPRAEGVLVLLECLVLVGSGAMLIDVQKPGGDEVVDLGDPEGDGGQGRRKRQISARDLGEGERYSVMEMQAPNAGPKLRVWVFAEPAAGVLASMWMRATIVPPSDLIQSMDDQMGLGGHLVGTMPDPVLIDRMPRMTTEEHRSLVQKVTVGAKQLESRSAHTETTRYTVVTWLV